MMRTAEWALGVVALLIGVVLAGIAVYVTGVALLWEGFGTRAENTRPWWMWLVLPLPPLLMVAAGVLVRRAGASVPLALGGAGLAGILTGLVYLAVASLSSR